jgi:acyl-CoA thioesterase FadM
VGAFSIRFEREIEKTFSPESGLKRPLCSGYAILVLVDRSGKPVQIPPDIAETLSIDDVA